MLEFNLNFEKDDLVLIASTIILYTLNCVKLLEIISEVVAEGLHIHLRYLGF